MKCQHCGSSCIRKGFHSTGKQKFRCKTCRRYQQSEYRKRAFQAGTDQMIVKLTCNSCGIRGIANVLEISPTTVIERLKRIAGSVTPTRAFLKGRRYEVDELKTYVRTKKNEYWVCCALEKDTNMIVSLSVGRRNKGTLKKALIPVLLSEPKQVYSDKLILYKNIIDKGIHRTKVYSINRIERKFLSFRTHLKRLGRRTICFSKSAFMLEAVWRIYLWYRAPVSMTHDLEIKSP